MTTELRALKLLEDEPKGCGSRGWVVSSLGSQYVSGETGDAGCVPLTARQELRNSLSGQTVEAG